MNIDFDLEPYLAKVDFSEALLDRCCVKKATVTGISSLQAVIVEIDGVEYKNIPVWVHTDQGARAQFIKQEVLPTAADYFKNAALMFPFPEGVSTTDGLTLEPKVLVATEVNPDGSIKEVIAVISVLQSVLKTFPDPDDDEAFPTYQPYLKFRTRKAVNTLSVYGYSYVSTYKYYLWDVIKNKFAEIPTYNNTTPMLPMMDAIDITEAQINAFTNGSIVASVTATPSAARHYGTQDVEAWCGNWDDETNLPTYHGPVWTYNVIQNTATTYEESRNNVCNQGDYYWLLNRYTSYPGVYSETFSTNVSIYDNISAFIASNLDPTNHSVMYDTWGIRYYPNAHIPIHTVLYGDYSITRTATGHFDGLNSQGTNGYITGARRFTLTTKIGISDGVTQEYFTLPKIDQNLINYTTAQAVMGTLYQELHNGTANYHEYSEIKLSTPKNFLFSVFIYYVVLLYKMDAVYTNRYTASVGGYPPSPTPYNTWLTDVEAPLTTPPVITTTYGTSAEIYGKTIINEDSLPIDSQLIPFLANELVKLNQEYFGDMKARPYNSLFTGVEFIGLYFKPYDIRIALL